MEASDYIHSYEKREQLPPRQFTKIGTMRVRTTARVLYLSFKFILDDTLLHRFSTEIVLPQHHCSYDGKSKSREDQKEWHEEDPSKGRIYSSHRVRIIVPKCPT